MSRLKSAIIDGPWIIASEMSLDISLFPPPETVAGLWQYTPSSVVPTSLQRLLSCGRDISTLYPAGDMYVVYGVSLIDFSTPSFCHVTVCVLRE